MAYLFTSDAVRCLGIYIGHNKTQCYELNWLKTSDDMQKLFESWKKRKLTIFGKACVVNSLGISQLIYKASILPFPDPEYIQQIKKHIFNFVWNKHDRIKRDTVIGKKADGGVGLVDIELKFKALKAAWSKILVNKDCVLNHIIDSYLSRFQIDINYILSLSETKSSNFTIIEHLPVFYQEILCSFNECKQQINEEKISKVSFAQQPIWNNNLFKYNNKTICFTNWTQSGILYVKDLFKDNGQFKSLQDFSDVLRRKSNWLCEYKILKTVIFRRSLRFDMTCCSHIQPFLKHKFPFLNGLYCILDKKCKFFYDNLLYKKFKAPLHQSLFNKLFSVEKDSWNNIYKNKIKNMYDTRISEFNYKLLNNTLCCNSFLFKCKYRSSDKCNMCNDTEDIKHLLYDCIHVQYVWKTLSLVLSFEVQWKHVILGFYFEQNSKLCFLNTVISFLAFKIYKYKMYCRLQNKVEQESMLVSYVKNNLINNCTVLLKFSKLSLTKRKSPILGHSLLNALKISRHLCYNISALNGAGNCLN